MKTYLLNIIPKLQQYSQKLDNTALLTGQHWVVIDDELGHKVTYIFRPNGDLLISQLGKVQKAKWEYLGNQTLLIDRGEESYLFKHGFFNENLLALKVDSRDEYAVLVTEQKYEKGFTSPEDVQRLLESFLGNEPEIAVKPVLAPPRPIYLASKEAPGSEAQNLSTKKESGLLQEVVYGLIIAGVIIILGSFLLHL